MQSNAAHNLLGKTLASGWQVLEKFEKKDNSTGAFFSVGYKVQRNGYVAFMKAFDFAKFFQLSKPGSNIVDIMGDMISAFRFERDLSDHCRRSHITKVSFVIDSGEEIVPGYAVSIVPYLVFDLADGDVRALLNLSEKLDYAWRFHSLHDIAVGLKQLHQIDVSHQDLKPSNILVFKRDSRIGDLGRSICRGLAGPYDTMAFSGDFSYAPPEIMYGVNEKDWHKRVFATDCYLLGSMVVYYFSGVSMSALIRKHLPDVFSWEKWRGPFDDVKAYLTDAFSKALSEFEPNITLPNFRADIRWIVECLCYPIPEKRGHPKNIESTGNSYNLERFISKFDLLASRAELQIRKTIG